MSIKIKLAEQFVPGNIKNFLQICKIYYYPPEQGFPLDKVWIYFDGEENKQPRRIRSLCFKNPENHKQFIINNIHAHIYQLLQRAEYNNALSISTVLTTGMCNNNRSVQCVAKHLQRLDVPSRS